MKQTFLAKVLLLSLGSLAGIMVTINRPVYAQRTKFVCRAARDGTPTTYARTSRGSIPVIRWKFDPFEDWSPRDRCEEVSDRFQFYYANGQLKYITTGVQNNLPIICVSSRSGGGCHGLLFTLKRGDNASFILQKLFDINVSGRNSVPGHPIEAGGVEIPLPGRIYINIDRFLDNKQSEND